MSVRDIAGTVGVSRSSVSIWIRDIELTPEQHEALRRRNPIYSGQRLGAITRSRQARERRQTWQEQGRHFARRREPLHAAGCMLYWAEGDKTRNRVSISNSDPEVLRLFLRFLRSYFVIDEPRIRVTCNLFADHLARQREIEDFWLEQLTLGRGSLCKSIVNRYSKYSEKKRKNRLPYGTCRVVVHSTAIVQHIFGAIQEYGGFERPEWLDALRSEPPLVRS